jgi:hypothetical protein
MGDWLLAQGLRSRGAWASPYLVARCRELVDDRARSELGAIAALRVHELAQLLELGRRLLDHGGIEQNVVTADDRPGHEDLMVTEGSPRGDCDMPASPSYS